MTELPEGVFRVTLAMQTVVPLRDALRPNLADTRALARVALGAVIRIEEVMQAMVLKVKVIRSRRANCLIPRSTTPRGAHTHTVYGGGPRA